MTRIGRTAVAVSIVVVTSCGDDASPPIGTTAVSVSPRTAPGSGTVLPSPAEGDSGTGWPDDPAAGPPDVTLRSDGETIAFGPHSYSTRSMVADGTMVPSGGPAVVVETSELVIEYPLSESTLSAYAEAVDGRTTQLLVEQLENRRFRLVPPPSGTYDVWLTALYRANATGYEASTSYVFRWIITAG